MPRTEFIFIDETGTLAVDPTQPYFALGLLKIYDTSEIYARLTDLKSRAMKKIHTAKPFEFKFYSIKKQSYPFYQELIDIYCDFPDLHFCCFAINKFHPKFDISKHFPSTWDAYIAYSVMQVKHSASQGEMVTVIADYISKPASNPKFYEREIKRTRCVTNAMLIESHASLFIQVVDVLLGCVIWGVKGFRDPVKQSLCDYLKGKYDVNSWGSKTTLHNPNHFSVWHFKPR